MKRLFILFIMLVCLPAFVYSQQNSEEIAKNMKPALLVIDVQNAFIPMMDKEGKDAAIEKMNYYIDQFRAKGYPVIRIYQDAFKHMGIKNDTEPFEFVKELKVKKEDPRIIKNYGDAFNKTDLDKLLKEKGVNTVLLCGLSATGCVIATYVGAQNNDYIALLAKDALISPKLSYTKNFEEMFEAINTETVDYILKHAKK